MPESKPNWNRLLMYLAGMVVTAAVTAVLTCVGVPREVVDRIVEVEKPEEGASEKLNTTGWYADPAAVNAVVQSDGPRVFADTPAGQVRDLPKSVYLWKAHESLLGSLPPAKNQNPIGSCVAHGTNNAVERSLAAEIVHRGGDRSEFTHFAEEATYAGSRIEVGKGAIRPTWRDPTGDGSIGAWAKDFVVKWGMVPRQDYPGVADLTKYDPKRCRAWGRHDGQGVPAELEAVARKFPVKDGIRITSWADTKKANASGYAVAVCSDQGFNDPGPPGREPVGTRDARGVCKPRGEWAHCMCIDGYHTDENGREFGHVENSWGPDAHKGPVGWGSPSTAGFWAESWVLDAMLKQGDSWAFSGVTGFPAKNLPLDWVIQANPQRERDPFALLGRRGFALAP